MVKTENKYFYCDENDAQEIIHELSVWNIEPEKIDEGFKFNVQSNNVVYNITVFVVYYKHEEDIDLVLTYPHVHSFNEIQNKIFNRIIWNWRDKK